ncbi:hypothetical protein VIBNISFn118_140062 [Vibrio nigripulchritudo SFn118]|nr:hypothetical protein VIBNISFn118_140062 [Vibrio nigripulchritudo SFn118]
MIIFLMMSFYLVFLLGILSAKYYSRTYALDSPAPNNSKLHFVFITVFYLKFGLAALLAISPIIFGG